MTVLTASGSELEHEFGFGVVRQLLERAAPGHLEDAAALAAPALGLWSGAGGGGAANPAGASSTAGAAPAVAGPAGASSAAGASEGASPAVAERAGASSAAGASAADARFAALHGLYWLVANLAAERPLLLAVDDAQWADEPSLRFLAYLARRVRELPVALVLAARPPLPGEDRSVLETIAADAGEPLAPAPLTAAGDRRARGAAVRRRRRRRSSRRACARPAATRCWSRRCWPSSTSRTPAPSRLPGVERVGRRVARRLAALGDAAGSARRRRRRARRRLRAPLAAALAGVELDDGAAARPPSWPPPTCSRTPARCASATR